MHVVATAGHVDHGKSSLVRTLTGIDPDRFEEEKRRGLTIDLGFAWCTLPSGRDIGIIDVPGHERFIRNMLAGVGGIDAALFVVAADEGWMPQSAEHLQILDFLDVRDGIVALTKIDAVDGDLAELATADVREHLSGSVLERAAIIPCSAVSGAGVDDVARALDDVLAGRGEALDRGRPRLFVDRSFTITGAGTVATGTLTGGRMRTGDEIEILPGGERARVRSLQTHKRTVEEAVPGSRVAANLAGLERREVGRGDALVSPGAWQETDTFACRVATARDLDHTLAEKGAYELFVGTVEVPCRLKFLEEPPPHPGRLPALIPGADVLSQVYCARAIPLEVGDRFVIRDVGRWQTVAGGVVLDAAPGKIRRGDTDALERLRARERVQPSDLVLRLIEEHKLVRREDLTRISGASVEEVSSALREAESDGRVIVTPSIVLTAAHERTLAERLRATLEAHHTSDPLAPGMAIEELRSGLGLDARAFGDLLERWSEGGIAVRDAAHVRTPTHTVGLGPQDRERADRGLAALREGGVSPPEPGSVGLAADLVRALERLGEVAVVDRQIAYPADVMSAIERAVVDLIVSGGPATVSDVRDAVGTTRKYAVPLLEYLDATGVTRRQGDVRVLGPRGRKLADTEPDTSS